MGECAMKVSSLLPQSYPVCKKLCTKKKLEKKSFFFLNYFTHTRTRPLDPQYTTLLRSIQRTEWESPPPSWRARTCVITRYMLLYALSPIQSPCSLLAGKLSRLDASLFEALTRVNISPRKIDVFQKNYVVGLETPIQVHHLLQSFFYYQNPIFSFPGRGPQEAH